MENWDSRVQEERDRQSPNDIMWPLDISLYIEPILLWTVIKRDYNFPFLRGTVLTGFPIFTVLKYLLIQKLVQINEFKKLGKYEAFRIIH